jgi:hypothetical protein
MGKKDAHTTTYGDCCGLKDGTAASAPLLTPGVVYRSRKGLFRFQIGRRMKGRDGFRALGSFMEGFFRHYEWNIQLRQTVATLL